MAGEARRILKQMELSREGLWTYGHLDNSSYHSIRLANNSGLLIPREQANASGQSAFHTHFKSVVAEPCSFKRPDIHPLFWSMAKATSGVVAACRAKSMEPELNGGFVDGMFKALNDYRSELPTDAVPAECLGIQVSDQRALGNETLTGSDFGIIVQLPTLMGIRYRVALIQAKRATEDKIYFTEDDKEQLKVLRLRDIGSYLFYSAFEMVHGWNVPVVKSATLVDHEISTFKHVIPSRAAYDFPTFVAFGLGANAPAVDTVETKSRNSALARLFDPTIPRIKLNYILVAILDEHRWEPELTEKTRREWRELIDQARSCFEKGITPFTDPPEPDPIDYLTQSDIEDLKAADTELKRREEQEQLMRAMKERRNQNRKNHLGRNREM
jgi:hypothetical protein